MMNTKSTMTGAWNVTIDGNDVGGKRLAEIFCEGNDLIQTKIDANVSGI